MSRSLLLVLFLACLSACKRSPGSASDWPVAGRSDQRSPTASNRLVIERSVKLRGSTWPRSTSSQVQGAETVAPARARTV